MKQDVSVLYGEPQVRDFLEECKHRLGLLAYLEDCHFYDDEEE